MKNRYIKNIEYEKLYGDLPCNKDELIDYLSNKYNINPDNIEYNKNITEFSNILKIVLFEIPEGAKRPRARLINRKNITDLAISNPDFIHIYSPNAKEDRVYMERLINDDIISIKSIISTPCIVEINAYFKTPSNFNNKETILSEMGIIRPITTPDWDNIGKKYCDMFNENIWLDDRLCVSGTVNKYYSIKPRIEILLKYSDGIYTKKQSKSICKSEKVDLSKLQFLI